MGSDYVHEKEIGQAVERHDWGEARVIPIIVRPSYWEWALFGKLQALPKDARPITTWVNRDEAWLDVVRGIRKAVENLTSEVGDEHTTQTGDDQGKYLLLRYREGVELAWADGKVDRRELDWLRDLANTIGLSPSTAASIEREVMGDTIEDHLYRQESAAEEEERRNRLDQLYARARRLHQEQEWQAVVDVFAQIHAEDQAYRDTERLLASAREGLEARDLAQRVATLYEEGRRHMDAREWQHASECLEEVQQLKPGYRDTEELLSRIQQELASLLKVEVPDVGGQNVPQASGTLASEGLELGAQNRVSHETIPKGKIIEQRPAAGTKVEAGSLVNITVSSGPQPVPPALAEKWWALALRGLVLVVFGLLISFFNEVPDELFLYGATAMVYGALMMTDGILAIIQAPRGVRRRKLLRVESRISGLAGAATFLVALVGSWLYARSLSNDIIIHTGNIVFYITAFWAICIGTLRMVAAIQLGWEFKIVRLLVISGALLVVFGMLLLAGVWTGWHHNLPLLLGIWPLASGVLLSAFASQARDRERSGTVS
jgi:hypothetical protein